MSDERDDELTLEDLLERFRDAAADEIETSGPGRVESYDPATQTADVTPMVRRTVPRADGTSASEPRATIRSVRVIQPRSGGFFIHLPIAVGDFVLLVIGDRDPARWRVTGELSDPIDRRAHHIAHAVAIPGYFPRTRELAVEHKPSTALVMGYANAENGAAVRIHSNGTIEIGYSPSGFIAIADLVDARLQAMVDAYNLHTHPAPGGATSTPTNPMDSQESVAASKARVE